MRASEAASQEGDTIFELDRLSVGFGGGSLVAVRDVSFSVRRGETLGIVGESGSGKSVTLMGAFGLLPASGSILSGSARFAGREIGALSAHERRGILGREAGFVFQNAMSSLDPVMSIGAQIIEALRIHQRDLTRAQARDRAVELLGHVGIAEPEKRLRQYPHEFSGGMTQRVMIAMALANKPQVLIADEPTTAVDATIQAQILELLRSLRSEVSGAAILVSHDLGVIAENTDHVVVMYAGRIMETGPTDRILRHPQHPYTEGLLSCRPSLLGKMRLEPIPGQPPAITSKVAGCPFEPRCPLGRGEEICRTKVPPLVQSADSRSACHFPGTRAFAKSSRLHTSQKLVATTEPLLELSDICVDFPLRGGQIWKKKRFFRAVSDANLKVFPGEAIGIVGESGSGKSTLARVMMRLIDPTRGSIVFDGEDVTRYGRKALVSFRDRVQMVFQDPLNSLNPRLSAGANAAEPLRLRKMAERERRRVVIERFREVGLSETHYDRPITGMSGGQLQRVGIARALSLDPDVLVMDEPVSALDVSVQAQILNLLNDLKESRNLAYVFISHDMAVVRYLCDRVTVMHLGKVVETGDAARIFEAPEQEYTRKLLSAVPEVRDVATA